MAVVAMQKVAILAHLPLKEKILDLLQSEGVLEVAQAEQLPPIDHTGVKFREAELQFAIQTLKKVAQKETLLSMRKPTTIDEICSAALHTDVLGIVHDLRELQTSDTQAEHQIHEKQQLVQHLTPWDALPYALDEIQETHFTVLRFGILTEKKVSALAEHLQQKLPRTHLECVGTTGKTGVTVAAEVWKEDADHFEEIAITHGWSDVELPNIEGTAHALLEKTTAQIRQAQEQQEANAMKRLQLSVELPGLMKVQHFISWLNAKQSARETMAETMDTVTLLGWTPRSGISSLEKKLRNLSPATAILKVKPDDGEEAPVLLKNAKWITPFESVTNLYGLPLTHEFDPTLSLSPFFILFFALCLTDAGYGVVLALIFGGTVWKLKKSVSDAPLLWLLFIGGIATFLVGILFGGWFGLTPQQVPTWLTREAANGSLLFKGQIWNLSSSSGITFLQNLSIALGITHLSFGMFLAGAYKWIHGRKIEALWMDFTAHLLIGTALLHFFLPSNVSLPFLTLALILFVWGKGYGTKWFFRPIAGMIGLVGFTISMLSNTLSYLRILALGLVTGALAMAVNMVAVEMGKLFPIWIAIPIIIVICVCGHLVSIALNTLGSFIHSGRLQFIEFFSQFFEGGGRVFKPLKRSII